MIRRYKEAHTTFDAFSDKVAFQLNDTHPTVGVAELMRLLMDENDMGWTQAWELTCKVCPPSSWVLYLDPVLVSSVPRGSFAASSLYFTSRNF